MYAASCARLVSVGFGPPAADDLAGLPLADHAGCIDGRYTGTPLYIGRDAAGRPGALSRPERTQRRAPPAKAGRLDLERARPRSACAIFGRLVRQHDDLVQEVARGVRRLRRGEDGAGVSLQNR